MRLPCAPACGSHKDFFPPQELFRFNCIVFCSNQRCEHRLGQSLAAFATRCKASHCASTSTSRSMVLACTFCSNAPRSTLLDASCRSEPSCQSNVCTWVHLECSLSLLIALRAYFELECEGSVFGLPRPGATGTGIRLRREPGSRPSQCAHQCFCSAWLTLQARRASPSSSALCSAAVKSSGSLETAFLCSLDSMWELRLCCCGRSCGLWQRPEGAGQRHVRGHVSGLKRCGLGHVHQTALFCHGLQRVEAHENGCVARGGGLPLLSTAPKMSKRRTATRYQRNWIAWCGCAADLWSEAWRARWGPSPSLSKALAKQWKACWNRYRFAVRSIRLPWLSIVTAVSSSCGR